MYRWQDKNETETIVAAPDATEDVSDPLDDFNGDIDDVLNMLDEDDIKKKVPTSQNTVVPLNSGSAPKSWVSDQESQRATGGQGKRLAPLLVPITKVSPSTSTLLAPLVSPTTPLTADAVNIVEAVEKPVAVMSSPGLEQQLRDRPPANQIAFEDEEIIEEFIPEDVESLPSSDGDGLITKESAKEANDGIAHHLDIGHGDTASSASSIPEPKKNHTRGSSTAFQDNDCQDDASSEIVFSDDDLGDFS